MGNSSHNQISRLDQKNWIPFTPSPEDRFQNVNNYASRALRNVHNNQQIEEYHVEFISQAEYMQYVKDLVIRKEPGSMGMGMQGQGNCQNYHQLSPFIYTVKRFINVSMVDLCSTLHKGLLYAKKVDLRLKQINDIPLSDQLYMTKATLEGFKILYQRMGYFDIIQEMIFIDKKGRVKVWIHPNLSQNQPYLVRTTTSRQLHGSQSDMIVSLLNMIEENTDHINEENLHFRQYLINKGIFQRLSFYQALDQFQLYCNQERLDILDYMSSIQELYNPEGIEEQPQEVTKEIPFRQRNVFNPAPEGQSQFRSPERTQFTSPSKPTVQQRVERRGLTITGGNNKNLYESQTDKRSIQSNEILYKSNHEINKFTSRRPVPLPHQESLTANYRQTAPQFNSTMKNVQATTLNRSNPFLPPRPQNLRQEQISFRGPPVQKVNTMLNSKRSYQNLVESRSSTEKKNTMVKFNYSSKPVTISNNFVIGQERNVVSRTPEMSHQNSTQSVQSVQSPIKIMNNSGNIRSSSSENIKVTNYQMSKTQAQVVHQAPPILPSTIPQQQKTEEKLVYSRPPDPVLSPETKKSTEFGKQVSYYSSEETFNLDSEIAEDLKVYLGYNPSD